MNIQKLLIGFVLLLIFTGGFFSGILYTNTKDDPALLSPKQAPMSTKMPNQKQPPNWKREQSKVLIGYIQDFRNPEFVDYAKLTHLIFSFAHPTKDGGLLLNGDQTLNYLRMHVLKAKHHNTKVILAVGGWFHINGGESYDYFRTAISNPDSRTRLVTELTNFTYKENLDGVDIDFEHPRSNEDAQNLATFTKELSNKLHSNNKELSIAVHAKIHGGTGTEAHFVKYETAMFADVDHVNIMAYDGHWDGGYHAANLSPYSFTEKIVSYWGNLFEKNNLAKEKLVLGVPLYAQPEDPAIKQISYATIIKNNPTNAARDTVLLNGTTYHYNGQATMQKKTKLALDNGFGGMMLWELGHDPTGPYSLISSIFKNINS